MNKNIIVTLLVLTALFIAACGADENATEENGPQVNLDESLSVIVNHELGETEVQKNPKKVIVFDFGILDTLNELGIEIAGVPQLNIPSYLDKYESEEYENVGSLKEPDFEKISEIAPDLIIISGRQSELYEELNEISPTIFLGVDTTNYMESFKSNTEIIGEIFDKKNEVSQLLNDIESQIAEVNEKAKESGENGLIILANDDKISAYGENSRFGVIHDVFGVQAVDTDIEASTHGMNVSFEYVVEQNPDILYVVDRSAAIGEDAAVKNIVENKLMEKTKAMQNDNIVYLNPDVWYLSGGGIVSVKEMIKEVSESLE